MKSYILILLTLLPFLSDAQSCDYHNLSDKYDFATILKRFPNNEIDSCQITLQIFKKGKSKSIQTIRFGSGWIFDSDFKNCNAVRSYQTHINENKEAQDNDFGHLIVADFNFDGLDDFAIKKDSGGNGGPTYRFYIQNGKENFVLDKYLSDTVDFFPANISVKNKTLTTLVHANAMERSKMVYKFNSTTKKWKRISHTFVSY